MTAVITLVGALVIVVVLVAVLIHLHAEERRLQRLNPMEPAEDELEHWRSVY